MSVPWRFRWAGRENCAACGKDLLDAVPPCDPNMVGTWVLAILGEPGLLHCWCPLGKEPLCRDS